MSSSNGVEPTKEELEFEVPFGPELGTGYDEDTIFGDYENGRVFDYDRWSAKDFVDMLGRDGKAKTVEQALTLPIRRTPWDIEAGEGDTGEAEGVKKILTTPASAGGMTVPMSDVIGQATSAFGLRKAFFEKVWTVGRDDLEGMTVYKKIAWRPASSCQLARDARTGGFRGFRQKPRFLDPTQQASAEPWIDIPTRRAWVYLHGQHRDPLRGYSDLEVVLWAYRTKQKIRYLWYSFLEGQALPKTIVRSKSFADASAAARRVRYLRNSGVMALEDSISLDPFESTGKGAEQFIEAIRFLDSEMSGSVLAGFTDLTSSAANGAGSYALSKDSSDFFLQSRQAVLEELQESINHHLVAELARYNFGMDAVTPRFKFGQMAEADLSDAFSLLTAMASSTANNLPPDFTYMLSEKVAAYLDLDVEKLQRSIKEHAAEKEEQAKAMAEQMNNPAMATAVQKGTLQPQVARHMQVAKLGGAVDKATELVSKRKAGASLSEYERHVRTVIDLGAAVEPIRAPEAVEDVPEAILVLSNEGTFIDYDTGNEVVGLEPETDEVLLAAVNGHHVPGTAYHWFHGWHPRYAAEAIKYRKGKAYVEKLQNQGRLHGVEPDWYQGLKPGEKTFKKIGKSLPGTSEHTVRNLGPSQISEGMTTIAGKKVTKVTPDGKGGVHVELTDPKTGEAHTTNVGKHAGLSVKSVKQTLALKQPHTIDAGDEGGSKLPFEGKGQTSKVAKAVIKEAEEFFAKKDGAPEGKGDKVFTKEGGEAATFAAENAAKTGKDQFIFNGSGSSDGGMVVSDNEPESHVWFMKITPTGAFKFNIPDSDQTFTDAKKGSKHAIEVAKKTGKPTYFKAKPGASSGDFSTKKFDPTPGHVVVEISPEGTAKQHKDTSDHTFTTAGPAINHAKAMAKSLGDPVYLVSNDHGHHFSIKKPGGDVDYMKVNPDGTADLVKPKSAFDKQYEHTEVPEDIQAHANLTGKKLVKVQSLSDPSIQVHTAYPELIEKNFPGQTKIVGDFTYPTAYTVPGHKSYSSALDKAEMMAEGHGQDVYVFKTKYGDFKVTTVDDMGDDELLSTVHPDGSKTEPQKAAKVTEYTKANYEQGQADALAQAKASGKDVYMWASGGSSMFYVSAAPPEGDKKAAVAHPDGTLTSVAGVKHTPTTPVQAKGVLEAMEHQSYNAYGSDHKYKTASGALKGAQKKAAASGKSVIVGKSKTSHLVHGAAYTHHSSNPGGGDYMLVKPNGQIHHVAAGSKPKPEPAPKTSVSGDHTDLDGAKSQAKELASKSGQAYWIGQHPDGSFDVSVSKLTLAKVGAKVSGKVTPGGTFASVANPGIKEMTDVSAPEAPKVKPLPSHLKGSGPEYESGKQSGQNIWDGLAGATDEEKAVNAKGILEAAEPKIKNGEPGWTGDKIVGLNAVLKQKVNEVEAKKAAPVQPKVPAYKAPDEETYSTKGEADTQGSTMAKAQGKNWFTWQSKDGVWHASPSKPGGDDVVPEGAQVHKPWGTYEFDTTYDDKLKAQAAAQAEEEKASGALPKTGKVLPKGDPTGKPIDKIGQWEVTKQPPVDKSSPISEDEILWGQDGQTKLIVNWWNPIQKTELTQAQKAAITYYSTSSGADAMNFYLRGHKSGSPKAVKAIKQLDKAMKPLPTTVQVHRGMSDASFWPDGNLVGSTVRDLGYGSTSFGSGFGGSVKMHLTVPAGIKGVPMKELSHFGHEDELLLQRGVQYQVTKDEIDQYGTRHITATVLPPPEPDPYEIPEVG